MNRAEPMFEFSAADLHHWVKNIDGITGITISGGEPFEQDPEALFDFLARIKGDPSPLSVMCYTGKLLSELQNDPNVSSILNYIDILVDGSYQHELNDGHKWRGSSNQTIYALNDQFTEEIQNAKGDLERELEIEITQNMGLEITGIPEKGFLDKLKLKLQSNGYNIF